jgi:hypothetical protein
MFIALPAARFAMTDPTLAPYFVPMAFAGAVGLSIGFVLIFGILMRQEKEILRLGKLVIGEGDENLS